ncbi:MAG: Fic family protein [Actinomycetota bacterium]
MLLFDTPDPGAAELDVLAQIESVRDGLRERLQPFEPRRWLGSLRRASFARAIQGSNTIEGYTAEVDDAAAIDLGEEPLSVDEETRLALKGYRDAMTFVLQLAIEVNFQYGEQLLKSLHFMMTSYDMKARPGLWRPGPIHVTNESTGEIVYEGADRDDVPRLMGELVLGLNQTNDCPVMIRAAMAHLNLVLVHPFRDGNGRMARCLHTLVLARERILDPAFSSIEEYLGANTASYYNVLAKVVGGSWQPRRDARPWVRFTLTAHLRQARTILRRVKESESLWEALERLTSEIALPERTVPVLFDAVIGFRIRNATYRAIWRGELTDQTASRDLRALVEHDLVVPHGEKRGRYYTASPRLAAVRNKIIAARDPRDDSDPFSGSI